VAGGNEAGEPVSAAPAQDHLQPQLKLLFTAAGMGAAGLVVSLLTAFVWYSSPSLPTPPSIDRPPSRDNLPSLPGLPTDLPTGFPTDLPTDFPTDLPTDFPDLPTDFPDLPNLPELPGGAP
jgi:hypothetical protein